MLNDEERREIEAQLGCYPTRRAASIEALKALQRRRRWISDESLRDLAELLGMTSGELDNVATFYNLIYRRPVGRHVILLCDSVSCYILGYQAILEALRRELGIGFGETTEDDRFTLLPMACLGACDRAPVLMVDEDTHRNVTPEGVAEILERYA